MKTSFDFPLWLSIVGYLLFLTMIVGFTIFLPWIVPVSLLIGALMLGVVAWGIHVGRLTWLLAIILLVVALAFFIIATRGFIVFVDTENSGKVFLTLGIVGLVIVFLGRGNREIRDFEKFIGFSPPLSRVRRNSEYIATSVYDPRKVLRRLFNRKPKSVLNRKKKKKFWRF